MASGVRGAKAARVPVVGGLELLQRQGRSAAEAPSRAGAPGTVRAFYSSLAGCVTTDPLYCFVPLDDSMVHRGHGVFDTGMVIGRRSWLLDNHVQRLCASARCANVALPFGETEVAELALATAAAALDDGGAPGGDLDLRLFASAGPGDFTISSRGRRAALYVVALDRPAARDVSVGMSVVTGTVAMKAPQHATIKSVDYLPNTMLADEGRARDADAAVWVDGSGCLAEGPTMNVALVTRDGVLVTPTFDHCLAGLTLRRTLELVAQAGPRQFGLSGVEQRPVRAEEVAGAREAMLFSSGILVAGVTAWDGVPVRDGAVGPVARALRAALDADVARGPHSVPL